MLSVNDLFERAAVQRVGAVPWGTEVPMGVAGVYVVATTPEGDDQSGLSDCPLEPSAITTLLEVRSEATVDGQTADAELLSTRLAEMWVPSQPIVYIGLAGTSVRERVRQFYSTAIGARAPHAGGWPVKMLDSAKLWVHYGASVDPDSTEQTMIQTFVDSVPPQVKSRLVDPMLPIPFANLTVPGGPRKRHGLSGVKESRKASAGRAMGRGRSLPNAAEVIAAPTDPVAGRIRSTQNVTAGDIARGALRVPRASKDIFPVESAKIRVSLGSQWYVATWNPRVGATQERSGTIYLGKGKLEGVVSVGGPRRIIASDNGYLIE